MARYTSAYSDFLLRLGEVNILISSARKLERSDAAGNFDQISAICRGALVLLCSHVEGYIKDMGEVILDRIHTNSVCRSKINERVPYYFSRDLIEEFRFIQDPHLSAKKVFEFISRDIDFWMTSGPYPNPLPEDRFNRSFMSPSYEKVCKYFGRFGFSDFKGTLASKLKADFPATKNAINHLVDVRNQIAHGDPSARKTPSDLAELLGLVQVFCRATDDIVGKWCKINICVIR